MESKKEYLKRILNVDWCSDMDTFIREYNNFIKSFNFEEIRGGEIEKIFIDFHKRGLTPARLVELKQGKEKLEQQLLCYSYKAKRYFEIEIKGKRYDEIAKSNSPKNVMIELMDLERNHSLTGKLSDTHCFLDHLNELWGVFMNHLYSTVDLIFSGTYNDDFIKTNEFDNVVDDEIKDYRNKVSRYKKSFEQPEIYYVGKNANPYKNIFLYCLNSYIKNFYPIDIITMQPGVVGKLKQMVMPEEKEKYTLEDVAKAYSYMSGEAYEKSYGKIKQQFRKSPFMQKMKNGRSYEFDHIEIPLATYIFYSKKNHTEPQFSPLFATYDNFIVHYYAPLLRANMRGEHNKLMAFNKYAEFVNQEFRKLTETVNDAYLYTLSEELFLTSLHLYHRCIRGLDSETIIT